MLNNKSLAYSNPTPYTQIFSPCFLPVKYYKPRKVEEEGGGGPIYSSENKSEHCFKSKPTEYNRHANEVQACTNTDCHNICSGVPTVTDDKSLAQVCHYFCILEKTNMIIEFTGLLMLFYPKHLTNAVIRN